MTTLIKKSTLRVKLPRFSLQEEPWLCQRILKCLFSALISSSWPQPEHRWIIDTGILQWFASQWAGEVRLVLGLWFLVSAHICMSSPASPSCPVLESSRSGQRRHDGTAAWRRACRRSAHKRAHLSASPKMTRVASTGREPCSPGNVGCLCCHPWLMESSGTRIVTVTLHFSYFKMTLETKKKKALSGDISYRPFQSCCWTRGNLPHSTPGASSSSSVR